MAQETNAERNTRLQNEQEARTRDQQRPRGPNDQAEAEHKADPATKPGDQAGARSFEGTVKDQNVTEPERTKDGRAVTPADSARGGGQPRPGSPSESGPSTATEHDVKEGRRQVAEGKHPNYMRGPNPPLKGIS